ncbi:hypothetical protein [Kutzneria kofuensis]|uniref:Uncharacterized protein n=1 Tax=Kutzneria kofuensis TaxID=103725 RepID=A0A7W9KQD9_9PSEU|nr:hypothetical protein [Kutzneria kofuensis]MBB5896074.1 hypothetical protein [Kutzneria kofuensis]
MKRYSLLGGLVAAAILAVVLLEGSGAAAPHRTTVETIQAGNTPCEDC